MSGCKSLGDQTLVTSQTQKKLSHSCGNQLIIVDHTLRNGYLIMSDDGRESGGDASVGPMVQLQQEISVHQLSTLVSVGMVKLYNIMTMYLSTTVCIKC